MAKRLRPELVKYLLALLAVAAATVFNLALRSLFRASVSPVYLAAVMLASRVGGVGPGMVAAVVAALVINLQFIDPPVPIASPEFVVRMIIFVGTAAFISSLVEKRRRAEEAEYRRRVWYESMLTSVGDGVIATDPDGRVSFCNTAAETLTGWPREAALGREIDEVFPIVNRRTGAPVEGPVTRALRREESGGPGPSGLLVDRAGNRRWIDGRATTIRTAGGEPAGAVLVFRDVTERRRAEETMAELAAIVASSQDAIIGRSDDDLITSWNPGAEHLFGYTAAEALGRPMSMLLPTDRTDEMPRLQTRIENGTPISHFETERVGKDGRRLDISMSISTLRDAEGHVVGASVIARDVTERREAERRQAAQSAVSRILAESGSVGETMPRLLEALGDGLRYALGTFWRIDRASGQLRSASAWKHGEPAGERPARGSRKPRFGPGEGLPGRAWAGGEPVWVAEAAGDGRHVGVAFPIKQGGEVIGVFEFSADAGLAPDEALVEMLRVVGGQVGLFVGRKRAEADLRISENRFRRLADSGLLGILITRADDRRILEANDAFLAMIGATREDLDAGRLDSGEMTPPEYAEVDARAIAQLRSQGVCDTFVKEFIGLDGRRVSVLIGAATLDEPATSCLVILLDVTERRKTEAALRHREEQLRLALDVARMGTWDWNLETGRVEMSADLDSIHGLPPGNSAATIEALMQVVHPDDRSMLGETLRRTLEGEEVCEVEFRVLSVGGEVRWVNGRGRAYRDDAGKPVRMIGVGLDITASKRAQHDLQAATEAALAANEAKNQFLAVLSHELRTPLTPVLAAVSAMIVDPATPPEFLAVLPMIRRNVELEARLIDDLLDVTRISQGKLTLKTEAVDAHELIYQALEICMGDVSSKGLRLEVKFDALDHFVAADPARLQQVFWNLIKNAVKFTPADGLLEIRTRDEAGRLIVEVADTGLGIDAESLPKIFNAFEQGDTSITRRFGGLGLGLAISRSVIELLGGRLEARSAGRDQGATFAIELPLVAAPAETIRPPDGPPEPATRPSGPLRVLLVEDNEDSLNVLARLLRHSGHEVATASTVASARRLVEADSFDLLVSDLGLPDGTGLDVIRRLRERSQAPAIALSGYGMESDLKRTREAGFDAHLIKPVDFQQLESTIRSVVTQSEKARGSNAR